MLAVLSLTQCSQRLSCWPKLQAALAALHAAAAAADCAETLQIAAWAIGLCDAALLHFAAQQHLAQVEERLRQYKQHVTEVNAGRAAQVSARHAERRDRLGVQKVFKQQSSFAQQLRRSIFTSGAVPDFDLLQQQYQSLNLQAGFCRVLLQQAQTSKQAVAVLYDLLNALSQYSAALLGQLQDELLQGLELRNELADLEVSATSAVKKLRAELLGRTQGALEKAASDMQAVELRGEVLSVLLRLTKEPVASKPWEDRATTARQSLAAACNVHKAQMQAHTQTMQSLSHKRERDYKVQYKQQWQQEQAALEAAVENAAAVRGGQLLQANLLLALAAEAASKAGTDKRQTAVQAGGRRAPPETAAAPTGHVARSAAYQRLQAAIKEGKRRTVDLEADEESAKRKLAAAANLWRRT